MPETDDEVRAQVALPGDPELDCDVIGLVITSVVSHGREVLIRTVGGAGRWSDHTGEMVDVDQVTTMEMAGWLESMPDELWVRYLGVLHRWRDQGIPLRVCAAPGKVTLLIEDGSTFLPFPRRPHPDDVEVRHA